MLAEPFVRILLGCAVAGRGPDHPDPGFSGAAIALASNNVITYTAVGRPNLTTVILLVRLGVLALMILLLAGQHRLVGIAYAELASTVCSLAVSLPILFRVIDIRWRDYAAITWRPVVASCLMGVLACSPRRSWLHPATASRTRWRGWWSACRWARCSTRCSCGCCGSCAAGRRGPRRWSVRRVHGTCSGCFSGALRDHPLGAARPRYHSTVLPTPRPATSSAATRAPSPSVRCPSERCGSSCAIREGTERSLRSPDRRCAPAAARLRASARSRPPHSKVCPSTPGVTAAAMNASTTSSMYTQSTSRAPDDTAGDSPRSSEVITWGTSLATSHCPGP